MLVRRFLPHIVMGDGLFWGVWVGAAPFSYGAATVYRPLGDTPVQKVATFASRPSNIVLHKIHFAAQCGDSKFIHCSLFDKHL